MKDVTPRMFWFGVAGVVVGQAIVGIITKLLGV